MAVEEVNQVKVVGPVKENLVRALAQEVLVSVAMRTVKLECTTVVHLVTEPINLVLVKSTEKKAPVRVLLARDRLKIALQVANLGLNLLKNSQNTVKL
jgi:hypothetical protein